MPTINVRDTSLYYEVTGEGDIPLFFIHGMCGSAQGWADQVNRLSDRFTCITYDRRGHSRSEPGNEDQSDRTHADDAVALIDALEIDRPIIVASSGGAVVAIELLYRYAEAARGAVLSEPPLLSIDPAAGQALQADLGPLISDAVECGGPRAAVDAFFEWMCGGFWSQLDEAGKDRYRDNAAMLFAALQRTATDVSLSDLASIQVPILVVAGTASYPPLMSIAQLLAENLPDARLVEFEGSGHVTYAEQPAEFADEVVAFVCEITNARYLDAGATLVLE